MDGAVKPQGPIYNGKSIYIGMIGDDNNYYVLTSVPSSVSGSPPNIIFQKIFINDNVNNDINQAVLSQLVSFRIDQKGDSIILTSSNGYVLSVNSSNLVVASANINAAEPFHFVQNTYQGLASPSVLMSGVKYRVLNGNGDSAVLFNVAGSSSTINPLVIPLPIVYYNSSVQTSSNVQNIFSLNFCSYIQRTWCHDLGYDTMGAWTTPQEARVGNTYLYCPIGTYCGEGNCVSYCRPACCESVETTSCSCTCVFNSDTMRYECIRLVPEGTGTMVVTEFVSVPSTTPLPPVPPRSHLWLIVLVIFIILFVILFAIFASRKRAVPHNKQFYREDFYQKNILV